MRVGGVIVSWEFIDYYFIVHVVKLKCNWVGLIGYNVF